MLRSPKNDAVKSSEVVDGAFGAAAAAGAAFVCTGAGAGTAETGSSHSNASIVDLKMDE